MKKNINFYIFIYLSALFLFSVFFLYQKHDVANDSTISEWLINYEGGFTKRGIIGKLSIYLSNFLVLEDIYSAPPSNKNSTLILIATPFRTWSRIIAFLPSATLLLISTPLLIGPGCKTTIFLLNLSNRC